MGGYVLLRPVAPALLVLRNVVGPKFLESPGKDEGVEGVTEGRPVEARDVSEGIPGDRRVLGGGKRAVSKRRELESIPTGFVNVRFDVDVLVAVFGG
jgi:hypothetical protein